MTNPILANVLIGTLTRNGLNEFITAKTHHLNLSFFITIAPFFMFENIEKKGSMIWNEFHYFKFSTTINRTSKNLFMINSTARSAKRQEADLLHFCFWIRACSFLLKTSVSLAKWFIAPRVLNILDCTYRKR